MARKMLKAAYAEGITDIIVTPHYRSGRFSGDRRKMEKMLSNMQRLAEAQGIPMNFYPGNEIYYRSGLEEKLDAGELSTLNGTRYLLVEFSPQESFLSMRNALEDLMGMDYRPILAHAERYLCLCKKPEQVSELRQMGCEIQVNAASVTGGNGFAAKRFVHKLLREEWVDYIGTDAHDADRRKPAMKKCAAQLRRKYGEEYAEALLQGNARERLFS